jgi:hypothetical protein
MLSFTSSIARRAGLALAASMVVAGLVAGIAQAAIPKTVNLVTPPRVDSRAIYFDANLNYHDDPWEYIGKFPVYGAKSLTFTWKPYPFPPGVSGAYRVALMQNLQPQQSRVVWTAFMAADAWADNPEGPIYAMGPFLSPYGICNRCPSRIMVTAETFAPVQDAVTGEWAYVYTPVEPGPPDPITGLVEPVTQVSTQFVINTARAAILCEKNTIWCD